LNYVIIEIQNILSTLESYLMNLNYVNITSGQNKSVTSQVLTFVTCHRNKERN